MKPLIGVIFDFNNDDIFIGDNINKLARLNNEKIKFQIFIIKLMVYLSQAFHLILIILIML